MQTTKLLVLYLEFPYWIMAFNIFFVWKDQNQAIVLMFSYTMSILGVESWATTEHHRYVLSLENFKSLYAEAHVSLGSSQL